MSIPLKLPLTTAAANWLIKNNRSYDSLASWDVAADGWPPSTAGDPLYIAIVPPWACVLPLSIEERCETMQRTVDPEENRVWVFVPGLTDDEIWLMHTKRIPTALC